MSKSTTHKADETKHVKEVHAKADPKDGEDKTQKASDIIHVGGDKPQTVVEGSDEPNVTAQEAKAERILASEARPLEQEVYASNPGGESETQFLERIMLMMRQGGWGRHLDKPIMERIKLINGK